MKKDDWFVINDLEAFIDTTRILVFNSFGTEKTTSWDELPLDELSESEEKEMDNILSHEESLLIAKDILKKQKNRKTKEERYLVNDGIYYKYVSALNERMVGNILSSLVNKGLVESAFDSEANDFIFWVKDETKENPETD